jgi:hypothetical protein
MLIALALPLLPQPGLVLAVCLLCVLPIHHHHPRRTGTHAVAVPRADRHRHQLPDGDFSFSLHWPQNDELSDLVAAHNALGDVLRQQRLDLVQRELLLDTMVQNTPVAMLLVSEAAHRLRQRGRAPVAAPGPQAGRPQAGRSSAKPRRPCWKRWRAVATACSPSAAATKEEVYHLARRSFNLNGRKHELLLLRQLTMELRRQEVQTWKKVIRVISHELNNSLAPLTSLAHSGAELVRRGQTERLPQSRHHRGTHAPSGGFILGYARFAKLPAPRWNRSTGSRSSTQLGEQVIFPARRNAAEPAPSIRPSWNRRCSTC